MPLLSLLTLDKKGNPITIPIKGKFQSMSKVFSDKIINHPDYYKNPHLTGRIKSNIDIEGSIKALNESHIGRTRHIDRVNSRHTSSRRIFRQGFDFIEYNCNNSNKPLSVGLNFISYQNDPGRLFFILTDPNWLGNVNFGGKENNELLSVLASGLFFVPQHTEPFPGSNIFL